MAARKYTSLKQIEANRKNSLESTGPRTIEGKNVSKYNALKHGLLSREVVITAGDGKESGTEFRAMYGWLREDLQPVGVLEEMMVERIAVCYWRLRRVLRAETGEIRRGLDSAVVENAFKRAEDFNSEKDLLVFDFSREKMKRNSIGLTHLISVLEDVKKDVELSGGLGEESRDRLVKNFGGDKEGLAFTCFVFDLMIKDGGKAAKEDPENFGDTPDPEKCVKAMVYIMEDEIRRLGHLKEVVSEKESLELEATVSSLHLPPGDALDKITRYETSIERQLYRAMSQLERLQRQRKGDAVPPPINLEISGQG